MLTLASWALIPLAFCVVLQTFHSVVAYRERKTGRDQFTLDRI